MKTTDITKTDPNRKIPMGISTSFIYKFSGVGMIILMIALISGCHKNQMPPSVITDAVSNVAFTEAVCGGNVTDDGNSAILSAGVCWSESPDPTLSDHFTSDQVDQDGRFLSTITELEGGKTYYLRAYAENSSGIGYGSSVTFETLHGNDEVITKYATDLTESSATLYGKVEIVNLETTKVFFEFGTTNKYGKEMMLPSYTLTHISDQNVSIKIDGLSTGTFYHYRIKAIDGSDTIYGNDKTFSTYLKDVDGNLYQTLRLGAQLWMKENLKTTKFANGDPIETTASATTDITAMTGPKYQWPNDIVECGRFYTYYAVTDEREVCPSGWHVPSDTEWTTLTNYLSDKGYGYDGNPKKISKSMAAKSGWIEDNGPGTIGNDMPSNNKSGFTSLGSGGRYSNGVTEYVGKHAIWWSSTENSDAEAYFRCIGYVPGEVYRGLFDKADGLGIRCVKTIEPKQLVGAP